MLEAVRIAAREFESGAAAALADRGSRSPDGRTTPAEKTAEQDSAQISPAARQMGKNAAPEAGGSETSATEPLSEEEQEEVRKLQQRDRQVRAHEQAHQAAAGGLARGGANFEYESGPDGKRYAVGGEVSIDTSAVDGDPAATLRKAARIRAAALAPADPSPQDRRVAAAADAMAAKASQEMASQSADSAEAEGASAQPAQASGKPALQQAQTAYRSQKTPTLGLNLGI